MDKEFRTKVEEALEKELGYRHIVKNPQEAWKLFLQHWTPRKSELNDDAVEMAYDMVREIPRAVTAMDVMKRLWELGMLRFSDLWYGVDENTGRLLEIDLRWIGNSNKFFGDSDWEIAGARRVGWQLRNCHPMLRNAWRPIGWRNICPAVKDDVLIQIIESTRLDKLSVVMNQQGWIKKEK